MTWRSLDHLLKNLEDHPQWSTHNPFRQILQEWPDVVGTVVAAQTNPYSLQRGILRVAASSDVWAQNLMFERRRILAKLNDRLSHQFNDSPSSLLKDIQFSAGLWHRSRPSLEELPAGSSHPSAVDRLIPKSSSSTKRPTDSKTAFQYWSQEIQAQTRGLPPCPACGCPTPPGELQRWTVCSICAAHAMF